MIRSWAPLFAFAAAGLSLGLGQAVHAETRRLAIVAGNNVGASGQAPLRFAEVDADKFAHTLAELGGVAANDLFVLEGRGPNDLRQTLDAAKARLEEWRRSPNVRTVLIFYFSGHSDGESLELGAGRVTFRELRDRIRRAGADLRLIIVDSCKSGSLLERKGGSPGPAFEIHFADDFPETGEAVVTSSAANESSLESAELGGSFFTHHFVSGLRGAADASGDGRVTLGEAYQYAFEQTTSATSNTLAGIQHPSYDYQLSGEGDLVLTELRQRSAGLTLPAGYDRVLVRQLRRDRVIAELTYRSSMRLALPPGSYGVTAWSGDRAYTARIELGDREERTVRSTELVERRSEVSTAKGPPTVGISARTTATPAVNAPPWLIGAAGVSSSVSPGPGITIAARVGARSAMNRGFEVVLDGARKDSATFDEYRTLVLAGYRAGVSRRALMLSGAAAVGAGLVGQHTASDNWPASFAVAASASGAVGWRIGRRGSIDLEVEATAALYRREFKLEASIWPALLVGFTVAP